MKKLLLIINLLFLCTSHIQSDPLHYDEIRVSLINYGASWNITFKAEAVTSTKWDDAFDLTSSYANGSDNLTPPHTVAKFDHILDPNAGTYDILAIGKYKISAWENDQQKAFFYLDLRTSDWAGSVDVQFYYDISISKFKKSDGTEINGSTQYIWILNPEFDHITENLEPYTPINTTVTNYMGHPQIGWYRPSYDDYFTGFDIYRSFSSPLAGFTKIATTTDIPYVDNDVNVGPGGYVYYKVKTVNGNKESDFSNFDRINYDGMQKQGNKQLYAEGDFFEYNLSQNYPNPFNPSTIIHYQIP
ncbi:hypothetical protein ACFLS9_04525 [Bacteroidota bacterium]